MMLFAGRRAWLRWGVVAILGLILFLSVAPEYMRARILSQTEDARSSDEGRFGTYAVASLQLAGTSPILGGGIRTFDKTIGGVLPHNGFLSDFQAKGIFALVAGVWMFFVAFREILVLYRTPQDPVTKNILLWLAGGISGYFFASLATTPLQDTQPAFLFYTMLAFLASIRTKMPVRHTSFRRKELGL